MCRISRTEYIVRSQDFLTVNRSRCTVFDELRNNPTCKTVLAIVTVISPVQRQFNSEHRDVGDSWGWYIRRHRVAVCRLDAGAGIDRFNVCRRLDVNRLGRAVKWPVWNGREMSCQSNVPLLHSFGRHTNNSGRFHPCQDRLATAVGSCRGQATILRIH